MESKQRRNANQVNGFVLEMAAEDFEIAAVIKRAHARRLRNPAWAVNGGCWFMSFPGGKAHEQPWVQPTVWPGICRDPARGRTIPHAGNRPSDPFRVAENSVPGSVGWHPRLFRFLPFGEAGTGCFCQPRPRQTNRVLDCGGKRSATPLSHGWMIASWSSSFVRSRAPSPLRFAGAVHDGGMPENVRVRWNLTPLWG